jgi:glycerol kinase
MSTSPYIMAIDAGTTGVRCRAVFVDDHEVVAAYREFTQHFPEPGWVEHDAEEIWQAVVETFNEVVSKIGIPAAIGITNQRETVVAWNRSNGEVYGRAIVWQDRRTAPMCEQLAADGHLETVRSITGLVLDPYFSGTKMAWMLEHGVPASADLALATIDSWILWKLTAGQVFATDPSNASRTMLFDIRSLQWSSTMSDLLGVPLTFLPKVLPSSGRFGTTASPELPLGIPISGIAGDQQSALFGQTCFSPGMAKNTYGTGSFILMNVGSQCPEPTPGLLTTVAWSIADSDGTVTTAYALEGAIFVTGAAVQWLRDGLGIISSSSEIGPLAESVSDNGGVYLVPAFTGLGSPWWDPYARGTLIGITRGTHRAHIARAVVEAMALQTRDAVEAMQSASGTHIAELRVDGGASVMNLLLELQADQLGITVRRPTDQETTALGAAFLAGLAEQIWPSLDALSKRWECDMVFTPHEPESIERVLANALHATWLNAVARSRDWAEHEQSTTSE